MCDDCISIEDVEELVEQRVEEETADLREQLETVREERDDLEERVADLETRADLAGKARDSLVEDIDDVESKVGELQSRELEKGAHLSRVADVAHLDVDGERIEFVEGDDGAEYARLPGEADPLERSGESVLATADLLPIQQLARMDDDMLASATSTRPDYIAAKVWEKRGEYGASSPWSRGGPRVREYLDASDVRLFIKTNLERPDETLTDDYAKRLAGDALDRIRELSKHRIRIKMRNRRKDGLSYKERRLIIDDDAEIPGESSSTTDEAPGTDGVTG